MSLFFFFYNNIFTRKHEWVVRYAAEHPVPRPDQTFVCFSPSLSCGGRETSVNTNTPEPQQAHQYFHPDSTDEFGLKQAFLLLAIILSSHYTFIVTLN